MKITYKILSTVIFLILILIFYLSIFGIETDKFNNQISNKIKTINNEINVELKKIKIVLDPFKFKLNIKTVGSKFINKNQIIEVESIQTQISLKSLIEDKSSIENMKISTKSIEVKNLISFSRSIKNSSELFILEKIVKKGYLIADLKLEFDSNGNIKDNYKIDGFIKDAKLGLLNKYDINKLNLIFSYQKNNLIIDDTVLLLNDQNFKSKAISIKKVKDEFIINGDIAHDKLNLNNKNLNLFIKPYFPNLNIEKINFSSKSNFSFQVNKRINIKNFEIYSEMIIDEFSLLNNYNLKKFFPNIKNNFVFSNNKLLIKYKDKNLSINGSGNVLSQKNNDNLIYTINKKDKNIDFKLTLKVNDNPILIDLLNYEKKQNNKAIVEIQGSKVENDKLQIKSFDLIDGKNKIAIKDLVLNSKFEILNLEKIILDYVDNQKQKNFVKIIKKKNEYFLDGSSFNANKLIDNLLDGDDNSNKLKINTKININIDKIYLDNKYNLSNFIGSIFFKNDELIKANLNGSFPDNKKLKFTVNTSDNNKITTLFVDKAESIVKRYKFIKGFDKGSLDFYSSKKFDESYSTIKIYDFKLKELPMLTKILTLASLQGIADILSGEGISFDEFEMNFKNKGSLMTIEEIYAIGPAISILMEGYVEKNRLISLRGTLVPATTINKFIGSLPVLGKILVGSKTGEGVFGVSFKIKGPPKNLETSVNPIKTLTPRFITRTLEKIKKN